MILTKTCLQCGKKIIRTQGRRYCEICSKEKTRVNKNRIQKRYYRNNKEKYKKYREISKKLGKHNNDKKRFNNLRHLVLDRDDYNCQICGITQEEHKKRFNRGLSVHHKDGKGRNSKEKNNTLDNMIALCLRCHRKEDARFLKKSKEKSI